MKEYTFTDHGMARKNNNNSVTNTKTTTTTSSQTRSYCFTTVLKRIGSHFHSRKKRIQRCNVDYGPNENHPIEREKHIFMREITKKKHTDSSIQIYENDQR